MPTGVSEEDERFVRTWLMSKSCAQGFSCFTSDSSSNAYAIANVMKEFTDEGVEVWLRVSIYSSHLHRHVVADSLPGLFFDLLVWVSTLLERTNCKNNS